MIICVLRKNPAVCTSTQGQGDPRLIISVLLQLQASDGESLRKTLKFR